MKILETEVDMEPAESAHRMLTIEWEMMDKTRFFTFSVVNSLALRGILYPLTVIKTRLQVRLFFFFFSITPFPTLTCIYFLFLFLSSGAKAKRCL